MAISTVAAATQGIVTPDISIPSSARLFKVFQAQSFFQALIKGHEDGLHNQEHGTPPADYSLSSKKASGNSAMLGCGICSGYRYWFSIFCVLAIPSMLDGLYSYSI